MARETTELAAEYAKVRQQFGRPIAMYQAVKHHCANMLVAVELPPAWCGTRPGPRPPGATSSATAAMAATLAVPAADLDAQLNIQVHGGIGFTWEHDAHLYLRRASALGALVDVGQAAADVTDLTLRRASRAVGRPAARGRAHPGRGTGLRAEIKDLDAPEQRARLIESGYVMPHWPKPYGRDAGAIEQLVVEQEFKAAGSAAGLRDHRLGDLTLIQHGNPDQVERWVNPAFNQEVVWCQLFSEPDAGSDAAGIKTRGTRTDGGWLVNGQKVWTSGAHVAGRASPPCAPIPTPPSTTASPPW